MSLFLAPFSSSLPLNEWAGPFAWTLKAWIRSPAPQTCSHATHFPLDLVPMVCAVSADVCGSLRACHCSHCCFYAECKLQLLLYNTWLMSFLFRKSILTPTSGRDSFLTQCYIIQQLRVSYFSSRVNRNNFTVFLLLWTKKVCSHNEVDSTCTYKKITSNSIEVNLHALKENDKRMMLNK